MLHIVVWLQEFNTARASCDKKYDKEKWQHMCDKTTTV